MLLRQLHVLFSCWYRFYRSVIWVEVRGSEANLKWGAQILALPAGKIFFTPPPPLFCCPPPPSLGGGHSARRGGHRFAEDIRKIITSMIILREVVLRLRNDFASASRYSAAKLKTKLVTSQLGYGPECTINSADLISSPVNKTDDEWNTQQTTQLSHLLT